jgi:Arm DNA-binding domain
LKAEGLYADGDGLYARVHFGRNARLIFRYKLAGRSRNMGLGAHPAVTLAQARERASEAAALVRRGLDPIEERKRHAAPVVEKRVVTFAEASKRFIASREASCARQAGSG